MSYTLISNLTDGTPAYRQRARLDGEDWILDFVFNTRTGLWCMGILALDGTVCLRGQGVVCNVPLLRRAVSGPPGQMWAISADGGAEAPGLLELGARVTLFYASADDPLGV
jgi:hypothetical protein